jgi:hypothetical protein
MRDPILRLKTRQMRGDQTGDAVGRQKSTQPEIGAVPVLSQIRRYSADCFTPGFDRQPRPHPEIVHSFAGAFFGLHHSCGSTIALPTGNNPPRPPRFCDSGPRNMQ